MSEFATSQGPVPPPEMGLRNGPPWEDTSKPAFQRWMETVKGVFAEPDKFFRTMRQEGGIGAPLIFGVIGGSIGTIIGQLCNMMFNVSILSVFGSHMGKDAAAQVGGNLIGGVCGIILAPIGALVWLFISAGITHLLLMLFKGANKPFETTFRVFAYAYGALGLLGVIPICGGLIAMIWMIVVIIIGLTRAQETTMGKSAAAVLTPIALCICCAGIGLAFGLASIMALVSQHN
ncbi:MAG: YIP1 family protein [Candidatus Sumerlaeota bacterium]|nr:YIP1 family protein [Candidatus Sumerlaeota bacterium]